MTKASEGNPVIKTFDSRYMPKDYTGPRTKWPTREEALHYFVDHPDAWKQVDMAYNWRSYYLRDEIERVRRDVEAETMKTTQARFLTDSLMRELNSLTGDAGEMSRDFKRHLDNHYKAVERKERQAAKKLKLAREHEKKADAKVDEMKKKLERSKPEPNQPTKTIADMINDN